MKMYVVRYISIVYQIEAEKYMLLGKERSFQQAKGISFLQSDLLTSL